MQSMCSPTETSILWLDDVDAMAVATAAELRTVESIEMYQTITEYDSVSGTPVCV